MAETKCDYLIAGAGLAGDSAAAGIRELDKNGSITVLGAEPHLPYNRPPLTKKLWFNKAEVKDIFIHDRAYYDKNGINLILGRRAETLDPVNNILTDEKGDVYNFKKLLIATGGQPHMLTVPGGDLHGICYYRTLSDYERVRSAALPGKSAVVIGGGFIGSEMAAALQTGEVEVTMVYPGASLCDRIFPREMGSAVEKVFENKGIRLLNGRRPVFIEQKGSRVAIRTDRGEDLEADIVVAGVGISPSVKLASDARLEIDDGIVVDEYLQTSRQDVYAAGDNARFPYQALGHAMRVEHWDNAVNQGKIAGRNMAGAREQYTYMPYFFSDLFELGYEAVGEVDARLEVTEHWEKAYQKGILYYTREGKVRGVMTCNVWDKVEAARDLIRQKAEVARELIAV